MPSLCPRLEKSPRIGWHNSVSCWHHGWHNKRSRLYLFSTTMSKPPQDYQMIVSHCCHKEDKSYCTSHGSESSRQRRSYWIFFCSPTPYCGTSPTSTKSNGTRASYNLMHLPSHSPFWPPPISSSGPCSDPIGRSYPNAVLWSTSTTCCPITS